MKQFHVIFSGRVQGVGFRYTTQHLARKFIITGWVKNLPDGRVELLAEGEEIELEKFFAQIRERMKNYIEQTEIIQSAATGNFKSFEITY